MAYPVRNANPASGYGYWRGSDLQAGGTGSGMGQANSGAGVLSQGLGSVGDLASSWEPSVLYLLAFVVIEMVAFHILGRVLK
jgi:hypothetical protein